MAGPVSESTHEKIRDVISAIPSGRVMTYGDIAKVVGSIGPRYVGRVLSSDSHGLPWWRVVNASGRPAPGSEQRALEHYRKEGTTLITTSDKPYRVNCNLAKHEASSAQQKSKPKDDLLAERSIAKRNSQRSRSKI